MSMLSARFTSEEICFFSRHSVKNKKFGNSVILDTYVKRAKANQLLGGFKDTFQAIPTTSFASIPSLHS